MRIVNRETFLAMPPGTVFSKCIPYIFDNLNILIHVQEDFGFGNDFLYQDIVAPVLCLAGVESFDQLYKLDEEDVPLDFDRSNTMRDGDSSNEKQLFAVWSRADVAALVERLNECITEIRQ